MARTLSETMKISAGALSRGDRETGKTRDINRLVVYHFRDGQISGRFVPKVTSTPSMTSLPDLTTTWGVSA